MYEDMGAPAIKRVIARQLQTTMKEKHISKAETVRRMCTSRSTLNRLLDLEKVAISLNTLEKAAAIVGRQLRLELV